MPNDDKTNESEFKLTPEEMARVEAESREQIKLSGQPVKPIKPSEEVEIEQDD